MKNPISEKLTKGLKIGTGAVLAAGVAAVFLINRVPLKKAETIDNTNIISQISMEEPTSTSIVSDNSSSTAEKSKPTVSVTESGLININTATAETLQTLSGIGETKAAAIVEYRETHGGFSDISEITNVSGIGNGIFEKIRDKITTGESVPSTEKLSETTKPLVSVTESVPENGLININTATAETLQTLSGIGETKAAAIVEYRETHGAFSDISEITNVSGIGEKIFEKIRNNITV